MGELQRMFEKGTGPAKPKAAGDKKEAGLLESAGSEIVSLRNRLSTNKERIQETGILLVSLVETTGTNLIASTAEGYWGEEKLKLGPVDLRLGLGTALGGYGIYKAMYGKGGSHEMALGSGFLQSFASSLGRGAGKALAEKNGQAATGQPAPVPVANGQAANEPVYEMNGKKYRLDAKNNTLVEISGGGGASAEQLARDIGARLQVGPGADGDDASGRRRHRDDRDHDRRQPKDFIPVRRR